MAGYLEDAECGVRWLSTEDLISINRFVVGFYTPHEPIGVYDFGLLESAQFAPAHFRYYEQTEDTYILGSVLMCHVIQNHPFWNGNKRTGFAGARIFLYINGYDLEAVHEEVIEICDGLARHNYGQEEVAYWLSEYSQPFNLAEQYDPDANSLSNVLSEIWGE